MLISNHVNPDSLEKLGITGVIAKLFMSTNSDDFLIAWGLVEDHPNCKYIRIYCKGKTSVIPELEGYFKREVGIHYNSDKSRFEFGNIVLDV